MERQMKHISEIGINGVCFEIPNPLSVCVLWEGGHIE